MRFGRFIGATFHSIVDHRATSLMTASTLRSGPISEALPSGRSRPRRPSLALCLAGVAKHRGDNGSPDAVTTRIRE